MLVGPFGTLCGDPAITPLSVLLVLVVAATLWTGCTINYNYIYIDMIILRL